MFTDIYDIIESIGYDKTILYSKPVQCSIKKIPIIYRRQAVAIQNVFDIDPKSPCGQFFIKCAISNFFYQERTHTLPSGEYMLERDAKIYKNPKTFSRLYVIQVREYHRIMNIIKRYQEEPDMSQWLRIIIKQFISVLPPQKRRRIKTRVQYIVD